MCDAWPVGGDASSAYFLAKILVRSPWQLFISLSKKIFSRSKHPKINSFNFENRSTGCKHLSLVHSWTLSNCNKLYRILLKRTNEKRSCLNASRSHFKNRRTTKDSNPLTFTHVLQLLKMQTILFPLSCRIRYQRHVTFRKTFFGIQTTVTSRTF